MLTYNNKSKHSSHGLTPSEARQESNSVDVKINLEMKAKRTRRYPDIDVDNKVKIYKKKTQFDKERASGLIEYTLLNK